MITLVVRSSCNLARVKIDCCDCSALSVRESWRVQGGEAAGRKMDLGRTWLCPSDVAEFRSFLDWSPSKISHVGGKGGEGLSDLC